MKNLFKRLPTFSADYSGVCNAIQHMRCLIILHGQGGCIGGVSTCDDFEKEKNENINGYIEIENEVFKITSFQDMENLLTRYKQPAK